MKEEIIIKGGGSLTRGDKNVSTANNDDVVYKHSDLYLKGFRIVKLVRV